MRDYPTLHLDIN